MIGNLKKHFARYGILSTVMSDNGPQFVSREFELFLSNWKVNHATSSPRHQQSNGKAEAAVQIVKTLMKKTTKDGHDQFEALLEQRNTPRQDTGLSPVEMMFGRKTRTMLPFLNKCNETNRGCENRKLTVKKHHDKRARDLLKLKEGQSVFFEQKENENWKLGQIIDQYNPRSYVVQNEDGVKYRRNRVKIRPTDITANIRDRSPPRSVTTEKPVNTENHERNDINIQPPKVGPKRATKPPKNLDDYFKY